MRYEMAVRAGQSETSGWDSTSAGGTTTLRCCPAVPRVWDWDIGTPAKCAIAICLPLPGLRTAPRRRNLLRVPGEWRERFFSASGTRTGTQGPQTRSKRLLGPGLCARASALARPGHEFVCLTSPRGHAAIPPLENKIREDT